MKYVKSVIAFSKETSRKIILGMHGDTKEVIGSEKEEVFQTMDAIANAISDSCEPAIIPDISLQTQEFVMRYLPMHFLI